MKKKFQKPAEQDGIFFVCVREQSRSMDAVAGGISG
jgi:hypothetical protein